MEDRELLELAAKAYWGDEINDVVSVEWSESDQAIAYTHGENQDHNGHDVMLLWLPIDDDGDAFRLAVKCRIELYEGNDDGPAAYAGYFVKGETRQRYAVERHDEFDDPCAATRRAIVRAAAETASSAVQLTDAIK